MEWLTDLTKWFLDLVKAVFVALGTFVYDIAVSIFGALLDVISAIVNAFPAPGFMTTYSLSALFTGFGADLLWFLSMFEIPAAFAIVGSGWAFRLGRKALTLGQW